MKKILLSLCLLFGANITSYGNTFYRAPHENRTTMDLKSAYKGMLSVITYNEKGNILHSGYGFFLNQDGTGIAAFSLFKEAHKAVVVDYKGNKYPVTRITGANSTYDLVKFKIADAKNTEGFALASTSNLEVGTPLNLVQYTGKKKDKAIPVKIETADDFEAYQYFTVSAENIEKNTGCPLTDNNGNVVAVVQKNMEAGATSSCAIDARFIKALEITSTSILSTDLNAINIPKGLPETEKGALTYIYMLGNKDSVAAINAHNDFVETYPENAEGYSNRASFHAFHHNYELCERDFEKALELANHENSSIKADVIHNNYSKIIYNDVVNPNKTVTNDGWTLDKAIEEAQKAYEVNPSPHYLLQQGHCFFAKKEYDKAYENYLRINTEKFPNETEWSPQAQSEAWLYAARSFEYNLKNKAATATIEDSLRIITLLDSTIAVLPEELLAQNTQYLLERAQRNEAVKQYRKAVADYYEYEKIIGPKKLNDKFYYLREQAEMKCHMYQQALDDIRTAIAFNPEDPFYPVEEAVILLQAGLYKEAIEVCEKSLKSLPENPDCYKIMGIAHGELKNRKLAVQYLQKAQDLGDPTVESFIQKYK